MAVLFVGLTYGGTALHTGHLKLNDNVGQQILILLSFAQAPADYPLRTLSFLQHMAGVNLDIIHLALGYGRQNDFKL